MIDLALSKTLMLKMTDSINVLVDYSCKQTIFLLLSQMNVCMIKTWYPGNSNIFVSYVLLLHVLVASSLVVVPFIDNKESYKHLTCIFFHICSINI